METTSLADVQVDAVDLIALDHLLDDACPLDVQRDVTFSDRESESDLLLRHQMQDRKVFDGYQELKSGGSETAGEPNIGSERNTNASPSSSTVFRTLRIDGHRDRCSVPNRY